MKSKEAVISDIMHDYNNMLKNWLKTRINGAWDNGYWHGRDDAMKEIFAISEAEATYDAEEEDYYEGSEDG